MKIQEETILRFFNSTMDRVEKKIEKLSTENVLLKKEMTELKSSMDFHSKIVDDKMKVVDEKIIKVNDRKDHKDVIDKLSDLEDRSRR
jgi:predicted  nucleic acid-binding Zn-ribbon protein